MTFPIYGMFLRGDLYQGRFPNISQQSLDLIPEPEGTTKFPFISTVFKFTEFVVALNDVSSENRLFIELVERVQQDLSEALRLQTTRPVTEHLERNPDKKAWIDGSIVDVQRALNNIGAYMESVKAGEKERGELRLMHKFETILKKDSVRQKLVARQLGLSVCHQSLVGAINTMQAAEASGEASGTEESHSAQLAYEKHESLTIDTDEEILRSPHSRKKGRKVEQRANSVPNIDMVKGGAGIDDMHESVDIMPAELPGCLPSQDNLRPKLSLRGSSGYFPSLPDLPQDAAAVKDAKIHELPGSSPSSAQSTPALSAHKPYRPSSYRKPVPKQSSFPTTLPSFHRPPSLESELAKYLVPGYGRRESLRSQTSNTTTTTLSEDTTSPSSDREIAFALPLKETVLAVTSNTSEMTRPLTTQEKRRRAHTRRLETAFGGD